MVEARPELRVTEVNWSDLQSHTRTSTVPAGKFSFRATRLTSHAGGRAAGMKHPHSDATIGWKLASCRARQRARDFREQSRAARNLREAWDDRRMFNLRVWIGSCI